MDNDDFLNADESEFETDEFDDGDSVEATEEKSEEKPDKPAPREKKPARKKRVSPKREKSEQVEAEAEPAEEATPAVEEAKEEGPPPPPTDHLVHLYQFGDFHRTISHPFTAEDAEAFATDYNTTAKSHGRFALAGKEKGRIKKSVPWPVPS